MLPYHGEKRRGSDAQCIPAAGCSNTPISEPKPSISSSLLPALPFLKGYFKGTFTSRCRARRSKQICPSVPQVVFYVTRKVRKRRIFSWTFRCKQEKVLSDTKFSFLLLLYIKTTISCDPLGCTLFQTESSKSSEVCSYGRLRAGDFTCARSCTDKHSCVRRYSSRRCLLSFWSSSQSKRVQCAHGAAQKPDKERREPAAALHQSSVLG